MKAYVKTIIFAAFIFIVDAFVFNQGGIALVVAVVALFILIPSSVVAIFRKDTARFRRRLIKAAIYILMFALVLVSNNINNQLASQRAQELIGACDEYSLKYGEYPDALEDLVPEFISQVPLAKFALMHNRFGYITGDSGHLLYYYVFPPFGRRLYSLEKRSWSFMD